MCGINGFRIYSDEKTNNREIIEKMNRVIHHRGPDESGIYVDKDTALGMTRLSIIDLVSGKQPISNEDGTLTVVLNGEIYNYRQLREKLINAGHIFKTESDTETVLHAYEEYGVDCLAEIKGMFAFSIHNKKDGSLFIARDRIGEKPLYYCKNGKCFIFASELKSILVSGLVEKKINKTALAEYLSLSYIPAPLSILENVYKLLPAHYITVDANGEVNIQKYWDVEYSAENKITDYDECKKLLRTTMFDAVEKCMQADVPFGAFLSGGIDSSVITGIMSKISSEKVNTFSIGFKDKQYDESDRAEIVAKLNNTNHHCFSIDNDNFFECVSDIIENIDEPFADSSYIATYCVSRLARKYVKTVLTGDAGDELFGGYEKYLIGYYSSMYKKLPHFLQSGFKSAVYKLPDNNAKTRKIRKVLDNLNYEPFEQRKRLMCLSLPEERLKSLLIYTDDTALDFIYDYYSAYSLSANETDCTFYTDIKVVLEGDMLCKVDRASMLASLETRVPMLYPDVVELSARIPSEFKINTRNKKIILKDTFSDLLPDEILHAKKKGFSVPMAEWLRTDLRDELLKTIGDEEFIENQGLFNYAFIKQLEYEHYTCQRNNSTVLWALYVFEKWYTKYFLGE